MCVCVYPFTHIHIQQIMAWQQCHDLMQDQQITTAVHAHCPAHCNAFFHSRLIHFSVCEKHIVRLDGTVFWHPCFHVTITSPLEKDSRSR